VSSRRVPGRPAIEQVEDLLFGGARTRDIKDVVIGEFYDIGDALPGLCRRSARLPRAEQELWSADLKNAYFG